MSRLADHIITYEQQIQSIAERTGQIMSAISTQNLSKINLRLQRGVFLMTFALLLLTSVLVFDIEVDTYWQ